MIIPKQNKNYMEVFKKDYILGPELLAMGLIKEGSEVLSIGCGAGREVKYLVNKGCIVTAIDNDKNMIELSKNQEPNVKYLNINALSYIEDNQYDYIICLWNTINYFPKKWRKLFIKLSYWNLKKNGRLIITTSDIFRHWRCILHNIKYRKRYYYFPNEINYWFKDSGLTREQIKVNRSNLIVARKLN